MNIEDIEKRLSEMTAEIRAREEERIPFPGSHIEVHEDFEHAGLRCIMIFYQEHFCGYVRVDETHPYALKHYDEVPVDVWGGLTFRQLCDDGGTWFGWDDGHIEKCPLSAREETEWLAAQLAAIAAGGTVIRFGGYA